MRIDPQLDRIEYHGSRQRSHISVFSASVKPRRNLRPIATSSIPVVGGLRRFVPDSSAQTTAANRQTWMLHILDLQLQPLIVDSCTSSNQIGQMASLYECRNL